MEILNRELAGFRVTSSPLLPDFSLEGLFAEVTSVTIIKENARRRVIYLQTPTNGYFLKLSLLTRRKTVGDIFFYPIENGRNGAISTACGRPESPLPNRLQRAIGKILTPAPFFC